MQFKVGQTVVYPHHGTASILEIKKRVIRGEEVTYLKLHVSDGDLMIEVPAEKIEAVGLRGVIDSDGARRVVEVLRENLVDEPTNWSRRYKSNLEKIASGDVTKVTEAVRDLSRREKTRVLSAGEKRMLTRARGILVAELALARHTNQEDAEALLDEVLAE